MSVVAQGFPLGVLSKYERLKYEPHRHSTSANGRTLLGFGWVAGLNFSRHRKKYKSRCTRQYIKDYQSSQIPSSWNQEAVKGFAFVICLEREEFTLRRTFVRRNIGPERGPPHMPKQHLVAVQLQLAVLGLILTTKKVVRTEVRAGNMAWFSRNHVTLAVSWDKELMQPPTNGNRETRR